jgi:hypothetical protein
MPKQISFSACPWQAFVAYLSEEHYKKQNFEYPEHGQLLAYFTTNQ